MAALKLSLLFSGSNGSTEGKLTNTRRPQSSSDHSQSNECCTNQ